MPDPGETMQTRLPIMLSVSFLFLAACGGGGGSSSGGEGIQLERPSVAVSGIPATESLSVNLSAGGETLVINADGSSTFSNRVQPGSGYTLTITVQPTSNTCTFSNGNTSISGSSTSSTSFTINCGAGGGGGGTVSTISGPFKMYGWRSGIIAPDVYVMPVSVLDFSGAPLTGATRSNFTFLDDDQEVVHSPEYSFFVQPVTAGDMPVTVALAIDISSSFSPSEIAELKAAATDYINSLGADVSVSLFVFDGGVTQLVAYTTNKTTLTTAIAGITEDYSGRDSSTDLYGAIIGAADSRDDGLFGVSPEIGYSVVITDGVHTANNDQPSSTSDAVKYDLVYAVGVGDTINDETLLEAIDDPGNIKQQLVTVSSTAGVGAALDTVHARFQNLAAGLHYVLYRTPRRDGTEHEITIEATPQDPCAVATGGAQGEGCIYFWPYDAPAAPLTPQLVFIGNFVQPSAGSTVTYTIPDWLFCSSSPTYQWTVTENQGSATTTTSQAGHVLELTLGATTPIDLDITATDTVSGCTASASIILP